MDYRQVFLIGRGSFGEIYYGERRGEAPMAVKIVNLDRMSDDYALLLTEIQILTKNKCKYLLQCKKVEISTDARKSKNLLYIVMPYFKNGDLASEITRRRETRSHYYQETIVRYIYQIILGVDYLHSNNIIHRDLKPSNVLITDRYNVKICDFNTSKIIEAPKFQDTRQHTQIGTPFYMSPECVDNRCYNFKTDIWSIGCILYELMELQIAFNCSHIGRLLIKIHGGKFNKFKKSGYYASELTEIVKQCINVTEKDRPTTTELIDNYIFTNSPFKPYKNNTELEINTLQTSIIPKTPQDFNNVIKKYYKQLRKTESNSDISVDSTKSLVISQMKILSNDET